MTDSVAAAPILEFSRYEFKYILSANRRQEIESELRFFMELDPFVVSTEHNRYLVRSLYFDDPARTAYYEKIDGMRTRSKFRIRTYCNSPDGVTPQFLEEKGRHDNRVFKHRVPIEPIDERNRTTITAIEDIIDRWNEHDVFHKFTHEYFRRQIRPVALVDYLRRPYISKYDREFRITFDEQLMGTETKELFPHQADARSLRTGYTIMEVKFSHRIPSWFHRIIQSYELRRLSISKICECMTTLGLAVELQ